ncbi:MAG TPA: carbohydrate-binding protein [Steroidobacteraceae bacterium]|nr:carbohydrate-binding protein [Steroidobacteraceae bacterium]
MNTGGKYRPKEGVDIISAPSTGGGFVVNNFATSEWMVYSISVATAGSYDIDVNASSQYSNSAYHIEIDGRPVTDIITVPNTGSFNTFQWVGKRTVTIAAGTHSITITSDQQYLNLDAIRISPSPAAAATSTSKLLFASGFEGDFNEAPLAAQDCWGGGCWQNFSGTDSTTGFTWPGNVWGGSAKFLLLSDQAYTTPATMGNFLFDRVDTVTGHTGAQTHVLLQQNSQNVNGTASPAYSVEQNVLQFLPQHEDGDMYISYWLKFQPDMAEKMHNMADGPGVQNGGTWRSFFALKTGGQVAWGGPADDGDYRIEAYVLTYGNVAPYWALRGDNVAGGNAPLVNSWQEENHTVPVPINQWFKFEIFWHRSAGSDGRAWMAVNGQTLIDHHGPNVGAWNMPINRIFAPLVYSSSPYPIYQWMDDLEIWDGFPPMGNNPPYAAH